MYGHVSSESAHATRTNRQINTHIHSDFIIEDDIIQCPFAASFLNIKFFGCWISRLIEMHRCIEFGTRNQGTLNWASLSVLHNFVSAIWWSRIVFICEQMEFNIFLNDEYQYSRQLNCMCGIRQLMPLNTLSEIIWATEGGVVDIGN